MDKHKNPTVTLSVNNDTVFLPVIVSFIEKTALAMGLSESGAMSLTLAGEEIFSYLCRMASPDDKVTINCTRGGWYVKVEFSFFIKDFDLQAFNLTSTVCIEDDKSLEDMGLLIASRFVDRFRYSEEKDEGIRLTLIKEKDYPVIGIEGPALPPFLSEYSIRRADPEELKTFALLASSFYREQVIPQFFNYPGKLVDMIASGEYQCVLAVDRKGHVGGGIVWGWAGIKTVECYGPYIFNQGEGSPIAERLLDACLGAIAKTPALGLLNRLSTPDLPQTYFEKLGELRISDKEGSSTDLPAWFRQMQEDPGSTVWAHKDLEGWLRGEYQRLVFPREIRTVTEAGETRAPFSVLSVIFDRQEGMATLQPVRYGSDAEETLANYLRLFEKEALGNIFFEMDLMDAWQACFTPALLNLGFRPRMVLPYAGAGDQVIFQRSSGLP